MKSLATALWLVLLAELWAGCGTYPRPGLSPEKARALATTLRAQTGPWTREREDRILALNPERVTGADVRDVLAGAPAPHIFNIHGGQAVVIPCMVNFAEFLMGLGYPGGALTNAADGTYTFSCYESSAIIAGVAAWYYERDGLRPMMVGHSQGGMQAVKVLHRLEGGKPLPVWNPLTWSQENRTHITDPLTGQMRPATEVKISFTSAVGAGGVTRLLPNQWDMTFRLRTIPDSAVEFVGFCKENDLLGGEFYGYGAANEYKSAGRAIVHNVWLPKNYNHGSIPYTTHLLSEPAMVDWINDYHPADEFATEPQVDTEFVQNSKNILWAAENWYYIKKHWVLELQTLIRARRDQANAR
jgi:hypothetical protein